MKCSGERSHAFKVATAPAGSSRLDFPVFPFFPPSSLPSSDPQLVEGNGFGVGADIGSAAATFDMFILS